jgi:hypothetical protein
MNEQQFKGMVIFVTGLLTPNEDYSAAALQIKSDQVRITAFRKIGSM